MERSLYRLRVTVCFDLSSITATFIPGRQRTSIRNFRHDGERSPLSSSLAAQKRSAHLKGTAGQALATGLTV